MYYLHYNYQIQFHNYKYFSSIITSCYYYKKEEVVAITTRRLIKNVVIIRCYDIIIMESGHYFILIPHYMGDVDCIANYFHEWHC